MKEFFLVANSFAAPFVSDISTHYRTAETAGAALLDLAKAYGHPAGLYAADCYSSADDYHKGQKPLMRWLCNQELEKQRVTNGMNCYSYFSERCGSFEINGEAYRVDDPKLGTLVNV